MRELNNRVGMWGVLAELKLYLTNPVSIPAHLVYTMKPTLDVGRQVPGPVGQPMPAEYDVYGLDPVHRLVRDLKYYTMPARPKPKAVQAFRR
jgi:hypothetical protein